MKNSIAAALVIACGLVFTVGAHAQQAAPKEHSMTGCLKKGTEANTYMVTDVEGSGPKSIGIVSSTANLAPHVGHKIEVTGTAVPPKEAERTDHSQGATLHEDHRCQNVVANLPITSKLLRPAEAG